VQDDWTAVERFRPDGAAPVVLVCEHASRHIPADLNDLGLTGAALTSHAAWDIGALAVARGLAERLDAPLVAGATSRLVYDLNRPLESPTAIPPVSEVFEIPGNQGLSDTARRDRFDRLHTPFHNALAETVATQRARVAGPVALITVHSFTRIYLGQERAVELGYLFHSDGALAQAALQVELTRCQYASALNEPYGAGDGVTYTLEKHGESQGLPALMIEVQNDLIETPEGAAAMADHLAETLRAILPQPGQTQEATA
jgi:predicted N-formylglutamate amidohydrolase